MFGKEFSTFHSDDDTDEDFNFDKVIEKQFSAGLLSEDEFDPSKSSKSSAGGHHEESSPTKLDTIPLTPSRHDELGRPDHHHRSLNQTSSFNMDIIWLMIWVLNIFLTLGLVIFGILTLPDENWTSWEPVPIGFWRSYWVHVLIALISALGIPILYSVGCILLFKTRTMSNLFLYPPSICVLAGAIIAMIVCYSLTGVLLGTLFLFIAVASGISIYHFRSRSLFTSYLLDLQASHLLLFPHSMYLAFLFFAVVMLFSIAFAYALYATGHWGWYPIPYILFTYLWTTQTFADFVYVTVCSNFSSWYMTGPPSDITGSSWQIMLAATRKITTKSFGSICFGSLILPPVYLLFRPFVDFYTAGSRSTIARGIFMACQSVFRRTSRYAYPQVGSQSKTLLQSQRTAWELFQHHGFEEQLYDESTWFVSSSIILLGGILSFSCAGVLTLLATLGNPHSYTIAGVVAAFSFIVSTRFIALVAALIDSGATALIVCFVDDPSQLRATDPNVFQRLSIQFSYRCPALFATDESALEFATTF